VTPLTVAELLKEQRTRLKLELVTGEKATGRPIATVDVNRPGLSMAGHLEHFRAERIQIIGRGEHAYCAKAPQKTLLAALSKMLARPDLPCLIITRNLATPAPLAQACRKYNVPLLRTSLDTAAFVGELAAYLETRLAPVTRIHGVLCDVYGLGVLIQGDSGIGKSECALELLKRGHILVSDDVVEIQKRRGGILMGSCPEPLKHYMEVRGLGIIDVKLLFGIGSILNTSRIELVVYLQQWEPTTQYERVGMDLKTSKILDVEIPTVHIPVSPGRNLAVLIEVAALNQRLRGQGYVSALTFNQSLIERMKKPAK
jgi:HPr kinase/phosphorylase